MEHQTNNEIHGFQEENLVREISYSLSRASGWLKFLGIILIVYGVMMALSIIGIIIAWLPIWMGVLLIGSAQNANRATALGEKSALLKSLQHLNNYFTIYGIMLIIIILISVMFILAMVLLGLSLESLQQWIQ